MHVNTVRVFSPLALLRSFTLFSCSVFSLTAESPRVQASSSSCFHCTFPPHALNLTLLLLLHTQVCFSLQGLRCWCHMFLSHVLLFLLVYLAVKAAIVLILVVDVCVPAH